MVWVCVCILCVHFVLNLFLFNGFHFIIVYGKREGKGKVAIGRDEIDGMIEI